ncbi:VOC family protein [Pseudooceanicola sp.]|uniref:VOC family protein n=1 Tax=Pseudooceanicola sp. TaxID=1914328 RepID=UPI002625A724|nr:VOC family protein [Pseudooceanicola sp.]MDF1855972.1 VOC family protein [Pseudooceanicola sp.]
MTVLRIVPNLTCDDPAQLSGFYRDLFGVDVAMDMGFIVTLAASGGQQSTQLSLASEGGSGTPVPALSIEADDLEVAIARAAQLGIAPEYGPVEEPWGVRRFHVRDPAGHLINVLTHMRPT